MKTVTKMISLLLSLFALGGCATAPAEYNKVFDAEHSLKQNQMEYSQTQDSMLKLVTETLIMQGFSIENTDAKMGIIKSSRVIPDKNDKEITYLIQMTSNVNEIPGRITSVTLAAHEQSTLRHESTTWWHLLWILPIIPTGHEYQTVLLNEGSIADPGFYADFFKSLKNVEDKYAAAAKIAEAKRLQEEHEAAERAAELKAKEAKAAAAKAEADRIVAEKVAVAEAKRIAEVKAKAAAEMAAAEKAATEKAEADRIAAEQAAAVKAEADRIAAEMAAAEKAEADRIAEQKVQAAQTAADQTAPAKKNKKAKKKKAKTDDSAS